MQVATLEVTTDIEDDQSSTMSPKVATLRPVIKPALGRGSTYNVQSQAGSVTANQKRRPYYRAEERHR